VQRSQIVLVWDEVTFDASIANRDMTIMIQFTTILSAYGHVTEYRSRARRPLGRRCGLSRPSESAAGSYYNLATPLPVRPASVAYAESARGGSAGGGPL
jgi:hypothetical protein